MYDSEQHLQAGNDLHVICGLSPVFVTKADGELHEAKASPLDSTKDHLRSFEEQLRRKR